MPINTKIFFLNSIEKYGKEILAVLSTR